LFLDEALRRFGRRERVWLWGSLKSVVSPAASARALAVVLNACRDRYEPDRFLVSATNPLTSLELVRALGDFGQAFFDYGPQGGPLYRWMLRRAALERRFRLSYAAIDSRLVSQHLVDRMHAAKPGIRPLVFGPLARPVTGLFGLGVT
jgi:hypothetical protein